ncbi:uncharacterized protein Z518_04750 [Rhinocladiella mackenziei CBS 650.93]|uniref:J domain-containing protein n=1 Tax=Rhinocladiella mackenziei CBS 650.93 TaxID=1442369 RepID=A0A0D2ILY1_9EURO|nr:uncharacterized protein Z518_04750 [Rhinocladiella mackenziei CBS 650.93]KIX06774.1 hypothetical protein Z518_04750 [Rhinocladiella mackenziei CBS 650.93]
MPSSLLKNVKLPAVYSTWQCCACNSSPSHSHKKLKPDPRFTRQSRSYTDAKSDRSFEFRDHMNWPCRKNTAWTPSPYDIFELERTAVYSKHKFYELVKMYHPDRNGSGGSESLTHPERLERYRLVVQAHEILSDPVKRRAYDISGAGWGTRTATRHSSGFTNPEGKRYGFGPDDDQSIFRNATWEDWEKWYRRYDDPPKQEYSGLYVHHNAFASFVILLAVLTGVLQATRAGQFSGSIEERARAFTEETHRFLAARASHLNDNQIGSDGRVKHFLEKRDPSKYGLKDGEEDLYRKHFADQNNLPPPPQLRNVDAD